MDATYADAYARLYREHWWWRVREQILLGKVEELLGGTRQANILDVGCGAGLFFDALEAYGTVVGVESDPIAVQHSGRWRDRIHVGELETLRSETRFDLILMLDVLEHLKQPEQLVRQSAQLLAPHGRILVTVPAFNWLWTAHDDLNHHERRYTAAELQQLVNASGLDVQETRYLFQSLIVPKLLVRAAEALRPKAPSVPTIPSRRINAALAAWFRLENGIGGGLPFGSSLMAIARRGHDEGER